MRGAGILARRLRKEASRNWRLARTWYCCSPARSLPAGRRFGAKAAALEEVCPNHLQQGGVSERSRRRARTAKGHAKSRLRMETVADQHRDILGDGIFMPGNKLAGGKPLGVQQEELDVCMA